MPSPRTTFALTCLGVLLAGLPLLHLTGQRTGVIQESAPPAAPVETCRVLLTLHYSGHPQEVVLLHRGEELATFAADDSGLWEGVLDLPAGGTAELEVQARWPEDEAAAAQAITLSSEAPGQEAAGDTQWTFPGEATLHALFRLPTTAGEPTP